MKEELIEKINEYLDIFVDKNVLGTCTKIIEYKDALILGGYRNANLSSATYSKYNKIFCPYKENNQHPLNYMLDVLGYKICYTCDTLRVTTAFNKNATKSYNLSSECKSCDYKNTVRIQAQVQSKYRAAKLNAIPKWADLNKIKEIYNKCPEGYHVDHVIPLQGKIVCGLHIDINLQYLTATENMKKSNKFKVA